MMGQEARNRQMEKFKKAVEGWTITKVEPNTQGEGTFILRLDKGPKGKKTIRLWGTDLGWWFTEDKVKKPKPRRDPYNENYLESPHAWGILPGIVGLKSKDLVPLKGITLDRRAATMWKGVMVYDRPKSIPAVRYVAIIGSIWGSGSDVICLRFASTLQALIRRVAADPAFAELQALQRDPRVTMEWEDAP
jgi:hypothetical protein